jgi:dipeptidyl aminopeptidase/acylaminoacyl peptidase
VAALALIFVVRTVCVSYRWSLVDFEPAPIAAISRHPEQTGVAGLHEVSFATRDGLRMAGWYAPSSNGAAIVITHGTNTDRAKMLPETRMLAAAGYGVLAFDWPGNGASQGEVHWGQGERNALTAAIDWLSGRGDVDPKRIGGLGFSMGGYMMSQVAAGDTRLRSVVLESTPTAFDDYERWAHKRWGPLSAWPAIWAARNAGMPVDQMHPIDEVAHIAPRPLLIIGGDADTIVPPTMIRRLYEAAVEPKALWLVHGAHHGDFAEVDPSGYRSRLIEFFNRTLLD